MPRFRRNTIWLILFGFLVLQSIYSNKDSLTLRDDFPVNSSSDR
jgi:hypothetical protein